MSEEDIPVVRNRRRKKESKTIPFSKIIAKVDGQTIRFHHNATNNDLHNGSYFAEALTKWNDQDRGYHFEQFSKSIDQLKFDTYAQLLFNKDEIITSLIDHLRIKGNTSAGALSDLLLAIAKDVKNEFYSHLWTALDVLFDILDFGEQRLDLVECVFGCICVLTKLFWKKMVKDIHVAVKHFLVLFGSSREYVRRFGGEALSVAWRKLPNLTEPTLFAIELGSSAENLIVAEGLAELFANTCCSRSVTYHSKANEFLSTMFDAVLSVVDPIKRCFANVVIGKMVEIIASNSVASHRADFGILEEALINVLPRYKSMDSLSLITPSLCVLLDLRNSIQFAALQRLVDTIKDVAKEPLFKPSREFADLLTSIISSLDTEKDLPELCNTILVPNVDHNLLLGFIESVRKNVPVHIVMTLLARYSGLVCKQTNGDVNGLVRLYATIIVELLPQNSSIGDASEHTISFDELFVKEVEARIRSLKEISYADAAHAVIVWSRFNQRNSGDDDHVFSLLSVLLSSETLDDISSQCIYVATRALFECNKSLLTKISPSLVEALLSKSMYNGSIRTFLLLLEAQPDYVQPSEGLYDVLVSSLLHSSASVRKSLLLLLKTLTRSNDGIFDILMQVEETPLVDCKKRIFLLRKVLYSKVDSFVSDGLTKKHVCEAVINISFSQYFVQFSQLWPLITEIVETYANGMDVDEFCPIFVNALNKITRGCKEVVNEMSSLSHIFNDFDDNERSDLRTARVNLLRFASSVVSIIERRGKIFVPVFLEFYRNEFVAELDYSFSKKEKTNDEDANTKKMTVSTMCEYLKVLSSFRDPKSAYLSMELRTVYEELLLIGIPSVQSEAFQCILSYKDKYLQPYREHFAQLLDEKELRQALVLFKISSEAGDCVLAEGNREFVMPILLRLICGKLRVNVKKEHAKSRKTAIMRYLGGCRFNELASFLRFLFSPILQLVQKGDQCEFRYTEFDSSFDDATVFKTDLHKLLSSVDNVVILIKNIARSVSEDEQRTIFGMLLFSACVVRRFITCSDTSLSHTLPLAKQVRSSVLQAVSKFFALFPTREHESEELNALRDNLLLPYLLKVSQDDHQLIVAPQAVTKFLCDLASLPSMYRLLHVKLSFANVTFTCFDLIIDHLLWNGITPLAIRFSRAAINSLLTFADEKCAVTSFNVEELQLREIEEASYGTRVVVAHVEKLLKYLSRELLLGAKQKKLDPVCLKVLSSVCEYVDTTSPVCLDLVLAIVAALQRAKMDEMSAMLVTAARLTRLCERTDVIIDCCAPIFSIANGKTSRVAVAQFASSLAENSSTAISRCSTLVALSDLEAWNMRHVNEPDFNKRFDALARLQKEWSEEKDVDFTMKNITVHSLFHSLSNVSDMALRTAVSSAIRVLVDKMASHFDVAFVDTLLTLLLKTFKSTEEAVREEALRILQATVDSFTEHKELSQLRALRNDDVDIDYFANFLHIQLHRRQRAVHRLVDNLASGELSLSYDVLNKFLVPIISPYLTTTKSNETALSDECLRLFNATMLRAPWMRYQSTLDHWLTRLELERDNTNAIIRVLVALIDAFHYDISDESNSQSQQIRRKLLQHFLPKLSLCINGKHGSNDVHVKAQTAESTVYYEDDDIKRAPVALATVKLLTKLPEDMKNQFLHGVVLKLCSLMISRSYQVRNTARNVTVQVMQCLGINYLPVIIKEMKLLMSKGFQLHVMIFTIHSLISSMEKQLTVGCLDKALDDILEITIRDQFSDVADEKEVNQIRTSVAEAKSNKTPLTIFILGKLTSPQLFGTIFAKLRSVVEQQRVSSKLSRRMGELLSKLAFGIRKNSSFSAYDQLSFIYQVLEDTLPHMENTKKQNNSTSDGLQPENCLLLVPEPKRVGALVKTSVKSRVFMFAECALLLLSLLLKSHDIDEKKADDLRRIDPFVPLLLRCLKLKYNKLLSNSVECISHLMQLELPSLRSHLCTLSDRLFVLLADYSSSGSAGNKDEVLRLTQSLFKAFVRLITFADAKFLSERNIELLLTHIEADLLDEHKRATAFQLLKSIVKRNICHRQLNEMMEKLCEMSITSAIATIRTQCREVLSNYIGTHSESGNPQRHIEFFIAQLDYETEDGRLSAAEMLHHMFNDLLPKVLDEECLYITSKLAVVIVNDESSKCRRFVATALRTLLANVSEAKLAEVQSAALDWLASDKEATRSAGMCVLVQSSRLLPVASAVVHVVAKRFSEGDVLEEFSEQSLCTWLDGLTHVMAALSPPLPSSVVEDVSIIVETLQGLSLCASLSVRHAACLLLGQCLAICGSEIFVKESAFKLAGVMCSQLKYKQLTDELSQQASKNAVFLAPLLNDEEFVELLKHVGQICWMEIAKYPKESIKRRSCFKLAAALFAKSVPPRSEAVVERMLPLLVRQYPQEMEDLSKLAAEVLELVRNEIGDEQYANALLKCQTEALAKSQQRKRSLKELAVTAPEIAADIKQKKNKRKNEARKRKIDELKPYRIGKRVRLEKKRLVENEDD